MGGGFQPSQCYRFCQAEGKFLLSGFIRAVYQQVLKFSAYNDLLSTEVHEQRDVLEGPQNLINSRRENKFSSTGPSVECMNYSILLKNTILFLQGLVSVCKSATVLSNSYLGIELNSLEIGSQFSPGRYFCMDMDTQSYLCLYTKAGLLILAVLSH